MAQKKTYSKKSAAKRSTTKTSKTAPAKVPRAAKQKAARPAAAASRPGKAAGASRKRAATGGSAAKPKKSHVSALAAALHSLPASGDDGFEGLVERLLTKLTGTPFHVRRSGSQQGRDIDSESVFVECKRYEEATELDQRGLYAQVEISKEAAPWLDMWVLATTRSADANAVEWLKAKANALGLDFNLLACGSSGNARDLDYLCAGYEQDVMAFLKANKSSAAGVSGFIAAVRKGADFAGALSRIRAAFSRETAGLPTFRARINQTLVRTLEDETLSRTRLNAPLASGEMGPVDVPRGAVLKELNNFFFAPRDERSPRVLVVQGDEGNGKSWAVASWIRRLASAPNAPPVFWFKSSACKDEGLRDLSRLAFEQLQPGEVNRFEPKLQRWLGTSASGTAIAVLDGVNERNAVSFWAGYVLHLLGETNANVLVVLTCRPETWSSGLRDALQRPAKVIEVGEFDEEEFALALRGQRTETVEHLWALGAVARKPRYLADALAYLKRGGDLSAISVEMLQYEAWKRRFRTRVDFPLLPTDFEDVLKHLASRMNERVTAGELTDLLAFNPDAAEGLRELSSGGVLRRAPGGTLKLHPPYLVEGLSLLLVEVLVNAPPSSVGELREQVGEFVHDTQRSPLTAKVCAAAAYKALADSTVRDDIAVAITLEFLNCQNAEPTSIEGVITLAAKRPAVIALVAEELWAVHGVDATIEQLVLRGLVRLAREAAPGSSIVQVLTRWASFIHEDGEFQRREGGAAERSQAAVVALAPTLGRVQLAEGGPYVLTRIDNQRHLRLARLALAVISLASRRVFFQAIVNTLLADAVMTTTRGGVSGWILASSREPLDDLVESAVNHIEALASISDKAKRQVCRVLLEAAAVPARAEDLKRRRREREAERRNDPFLQAWLAPSREEVPAYLVNRQVAGRWRLEVASRYASDPAFAFPAEFIREVEEAGKSFPAAARRMFLGHTAEEHTLEHLEPLLCRLSPEIFEQKALEFVRHVSQRADESVYPWLWAADDYVSLFGLPEVDAIAQTWARFSGRTTGETDNQRTTEFSLFGLLLPFMTPAEQVAELIKRGGDRPQMVSYQSDFLQLPKEEDQIELVSMAAAAEDLLPVLWYGSSQETVHAGVWVPLVDRALPSSNSVIRAFALELLARMPSDAIASRVKLAAVSSPASATHLERYWSTRLRLQYETGGIPSQLLADCDLTTCAEVLGDIEPKRRSALATAFGGHVLAWLRSQVKPSEPPIPQLRVTVHSPRKGQEGVAAVSVDWSQMNDSISMRSEMHTWGGLEPGDAADIFGGAMGGGGFDELQDALTQALESAAARGNWAYAAFWSNDTLNVLLDEVKGFIEEAASLIEEAKNRRKLRSVASFISALSRALMKKGDERGLAFASLLNSHDVTVRQIDGWTDIDLFDAALFAFPAPDAAQGLWLERIDTAPSDAHVLACCELLVCGGNSAWLREQAVRDLSALAPYSRRRGLLLFAGSGCSRAELDAAAVRLGDAVIGLDDVLKVARMYVERQDWMRAWALTMVRATSLREAQCAAVLLLHCADARVWDVLKEVVAQHGEPLSGAKLWHLVPREEVKRSIKSTLKERSKSLYGYQKVENDAAPWVPSEAGPTVRLAT